MARYAVVKNGVTENIIEWDGDEFYRAAMEARGYALTPIAEAPPLAEGPAEVPARVRRFQALAALDEAGLLDEAQALVDASASLVQLAWREETEFHRDSPTIIALWAALGKSPQELDALFVRAAHIAV